MDKKRILFVDDNQGILDGLRRALRPERKNWDMSFLASGEEALELLSQKSFDAVVTDMRMPGINGVQLLDEVSRLYPNVVRFILSGHSKDDMTLQSVKSAHQFFPKPCNIDSLKAALSKSFSLRDLLVDKKLQTVVSGLDALPSPPHLYSTLVGKLKLSEISINEIEEIISQDPAISTKVIQLVNSAFFGLGRQVSNPEEAVTLLGVDIIKHLVLSVDLFSQFDEQKLSRSGFILEKSVDHSVRVGLIAKRIAISEEAEKQIIEQSYLAGFLHDVGIFVLVDSMPEKYKKVVELEQNEHMDTYIAEREIFGADHAAVGAYLFGLWGFSDPVLEAVAFHHIPHKVGGTKFTPLTAVHVASTLENVRSEKSAGPVSDRLDMQYLSCLGLEDRIQVWETLCNDELTDRDRS